MPEHIMNLLARLREPGDNPLTAEELTELRTALRGRRDEIRNAEDGLTDESVAELQDIAAAVGEIATQETTIVEAQAARDAAAQAAIDAIGEDEASADPDAEVADPDAAADDATSPDPAAAPADPAAPAAVPDPAPPTAADPATAPVAEAPAPVAEPIAASAAPARPTPGQAARALAPAFIPSRRPGTEAPSSSPHARETLVASGGPTDVPAGTAFESMTEVAEATITAYQRIGTPGRAMVASLRTEYPEERRLRRGQTEENMAKIDAVLSEAMVASGGICGPVAIDYTIPSWATTDRPIKAGLPSFQADRGGLTFVQPTGISNWTDATGQWTEATDASPGTATKPVHVVTCGNTETVYVDAIPTRLRMGNMMGRYFPEQIAYNTNQAFAQAARDAETILWDKMIASSTVVHAPQYLGATRDLLAYVGLGAVGLRDRARAADGQRCRVVIHRLFKEMLRSDLAREIGHAQSTEFNALAVTDAMIEDWLDARGITAVWSLDSPTAHTYNGVAVVAQAVAAQSAGAVLADWPASCAFTLFLEGSYQFLDGGRLDLGLVRDSILDATNDYETFVEPFETVAFRGIEALTVVVPIVPNGASAGTIAPSEPSE